MQFPKELKYTKDHEWIKIQDDGSAYIGITDFAQSELGDIVFVDVESSGEILEKEEVFGSVEAVKTVSDLFMPLSGEVIEYNQQLEDKPDLINSSPFTDGWIIKIKISDLNDIEALTNSV